MEVEQIAKLHKFTNKTPKPQNPKNRNTNYLFNQKYTMADKAKENKPTKGKEPTEEVLVSMSL